PVASMAVFVDGQPARQEYRRYRVKTVEGSDDYASMREILGRRLQRGLREGKLPDLLVVDGGKGQLGAARAVLQDLGLSELAVIGLAKPRTEHARGDRSASDKIILPGARDPLRLRHGNPALQLLQALRDESHRTAVRYHRKVRGKRTLSSSLETLPGVGPRRMRALLEHFGSVRALTAATEAEIAQVPGIGLKLASTIARELGG
ncbi:MAG: helix-hairpin-helix domain-containing protein, partial [Myxococcota bacterium]|nr:helix-hairpin-helix domain-containing protein [Myxococcota bacterium]